MDPPTSLGIVGTFRAISKTQNSRGLLSIQLHNAKKAGKHWDLRISLSNIAFSWVVPKMRLPEIGEKLLAIRTFDHTKKYQSFQGKLGPGYGEGDVKLIKAGPVTIISSDKNKLSFKILGETGILILRRTQGKKWIFIRTKGGINKLASFLPSTKPIDK